MAFSVVKSWGGQRLCRRSGASSLSTTTSQGSIKVAISRASSPELSTRTLRTLGATSMEAGRKLRETGGEVGKCTAFG